LLKDVLNSFRKKAGFTNTELRIILFLFAVFFVGLGVKIFQPGVYAKYENFDYKKDDSLFAAADSIKKTSPVEVKDSIGSKPVTEADLIRKENFQSKSKAPLAEKSVNINKAKLEELTLLPGIGTKTAEKIISLRNERGGFKKINDLLDVKGIGEKKLEKIKKLIFIE
jgi:competence protein ComEA